MQREENRPHRQTAALLAFGAYIAAMVFFALVRACGMLWFQQEYVHAEIPVWAGNIILSALWVFEICLILKILTPISWKWALLIAEPLAALDYLFAYGWQYILVDGIVFLFLPLLINKDRERSAGYSILFIAGINLYQLLMMFGRGYPMMAKFDPVWQMLGTIDYKFFLLSVFAVKGVVKMGPRGCAFFFGKFDDFARKIGSVVLWPFTRGRDA